jgi:hypothetical protein
LQPGEPLLHLRGKADAMFDEVIRNFCRLL